MTSMISKRECEPAGLYLRTVGHYGGPAAVSSPTGAYFASHLLKARSHMPPARTQSVWFVYLLKSPDMPPEGLADGDVDEPVDEPPVAPGDVAPLPEVGPEPVVPDGLLEPVPEGLLASGADEPLPVCAATSAGVRATRATRSVSISFCMCFLRCWTSRQAHP
jgi:hypothetical protein